MAYDLAGLQAARDAKFTEWQALTDLINHSEDGTTVDIITLRQQVWKELTDLNTLIQQASAGQVVTKYGRAI